jgi:RNA polymerase sigma-70 factor, ECF subfamily
MLGRENTAQVGKDGIVAIAELTWIPRTAHRTALSTAGVTRKEGTLSLLPGFRTADADELSAPEAAQSDDTLVGMLPARDGAARAALAVLYARYGGAVYGLGLRMLGDTGAAENLVQETFWRLWQHADHYEPGRVRLATWLLRLARNRAISDLRAAACRPKLVTHRAISAEGDHSDAGGPLVEASDPSEDVPDLVWQAERRRLIREGLASLPPEQREVVELAYFRGLTHREIAAAQCAPPSTIKTRLALGLRKLALHLGKHGLSAQAF